jgi:hypothetical protein
MPNDSNASKEMAPCLLYPGIREGKDPCLIDKRNMIASVFIAMLIGLAYSEMFPPVRESVRKNGITLATMFLAFTFFFTSMRFFIGNQLHLLSDHVVKMRGDMWLYDFLIITFETVLLCFLGGLSSLEINRMVTVDFIDLLVALYCVDILWILSQWLLGLVFKKWHRKAMPWAWAVMNTILVIIILSLRLFMADIYSTAGLASILGMNTAAFVMDIILIDHYNII